jgi:UTP--glucose-1-phosphate uridylyltransferase
MKIKKAVIVAGGWGTRFLPITKSQPKEMLPLVDRPVIQFAVEEAVACGAELVIIVTAQGKRAIEDYFDRNAELEAFLEQKGEFERLQKIRRLSNMADICYVRQKAQLGLGHAVLTSKRVVGKEPFMLILPDDLFEHQELMLKQMLGIYEQYSSSVVALRRVNEDQVSRYGIVNPVKVDENIYELRGVIEKPSRDIAPSNLAIMGRYILMPEIFEALEATLPGTGREIQLTDALGLLLGRQTIHGYLFDGDYYDAGTPLGWIKATITLASKHPEMGPAVREYIKNLYLMLEGTAYNHKEQSIAVKAFDTNQ